MLDPKQTEALLAVAETGSFEAAANRLNITASAVSQRVRTLEISLGHALLLRTRPVRPTQTGRRLLQYLRRQALLQAELAAELAHHADAPLTLPLAVNADSLATWFFPAMAGVLNDTSVHLELSVEDQDHTYALLESGLVAGCVSTEAISMRGCTAEPLGAMRYRLVSTANFQRRWFPRGLTRATAARAPIVAYTPKDRLPTQFLSQRFGLLPGAYPCHHVPGAEAHLAAVLWELGYALAPEILLAPHAAQLIDLAPDHPVDVSLYWHRWNVQSPRMDSISRQLVAAARQSLDQHLIQAAPDLQSPP